MATIDIAPITVPDADLPDVQAAMKAHYATNGVPSPTNAQMLEFMRQDVIQKIRSVTKAYRLAQVVVNTPGAT
jgi:hypothetical protein